MDGGVVGLVGRKENLVGKVPELSVCRCFVGVVENFVSHERCPSTSFVFASHVRKGHDDAFVVVHDGSLVGVDIRPHLSLPLCVCLRIPVIFVGFGDKGFTKPGYDDRQGCRRLFIDIGGMVYYVGHVWNRYEEAGIWEREEEVEEEDSDEMVTGDAGFDSRGRFQDTAYSLLRLKSYNASGMGPGHVGLIWESRVRFVDVEKVLGDEVDDELAN